MAFVDRSTNLEEQRVEVDGSQVGAALLESISRVVAGLSDTSIVHEVFVKIGFQNLPIIVLIDKLEYRDPVLLGKGLQDVGEVSRFRLGRDTLTGRSVSGQTSLNVERRLGHPVSMVLLDGGSHGSLEPFDVCRLLFPRHLVVDLKG